MTDEQRRDSRSGEVDRMGLASEIEDELDIAGARSDDIEFTEPQLRLIVEALRAQGSETPPAFTPTHRHADGGLYQRIDFGNVKMGIDADWEVAVFYKASDGKLYGTSSLRWADRFTPLGGRPREG